MTVMSMRNRPPSALVLAIALAVSACSAAATSSPSAGESAVVVPSQSLQPSDHGCPHPDGAMCRGPLRAGGPYKTQLFVPVFSHFVAEGWDNIVDSPNEYHLMRSDPDGEATAIGIYMFRDVATQAATCEDKPETGIGRTAADMTAYMRNHRGLITTEPEVVNVGGLGGESIEVTLDPSWTQTCHYSGGEPNVPLFWGSQADSGLEWSVGPGAKSRFYILDMPGGGNILMDIAAASDGAEFDALREASIPVIESITFDPNYY